MTASLLTMGFAVDGATNPCNAQPRLEAPPLDGAKDFGGLPEGTGRETVFNRCAVCHSIRTVTQQRLSRKIWKETMDWMVEEQGMAPLDQRTRKKILDYLSQQLRSRTTALARISHQDLGFWGKLAKQVGRSAAQA